LGVGRCVMWSVLDNFARMDFLGWPRLGLRLPSKGEVNSVLQGRVDGPWACHRTGHLSLAGQRTSGATMRGRGNRQLISGSCHRDRLDEVVPGLPFVFCKEGTFRLRTEEPRSHMFNGDYLIHLLGNRPGCSDLNWRFLFCPTSTGGFRPGGGCISLGAAYEY
jgi:hypothetical protein